MKKIEILTPGSKAPREDYPEEFRKYMYEIEDCHFWHHGRNEVIDRIIRVHLPFKNRLSYLEVGCGNGIVVSHLENDFHWKLTGLDLSVSALTLAQRRTSARLVRADIFTANISEKYDVIGLFDVIEHIQDEVGFIQQCKKFLKRNGHVIITVPALQALWSEVDVASGHKRRYSIKSLKLMLQTAGLSVDYISYYGLSLLPLMWFSRRIKLGSHTKNNITVLRQSLKVPPRPINNILKILFQIESKFMGNQSFPIGTSLIAVVHST